MKIKEIICIFITFMHVPIVERTGRQWCVWRHHEKAVIYVRAGKSITSLSLRSILSFEEAFESCTEAQRELIMAAALCVLL